MNIGPYLFQLIPFFILFYMSIEIYLRDPKSKVHRASMLLFLTFGLLFFGQFVFNIVPLEDAAYSIRYLSLASAFLIMASGLHFLDMLNRSDERQGSFHVTSFLPLTGFAAILSNHSFLWISASQGPHWRSELYSAPLTTIIIGLVLYSFTGYALHVYSAKRKAAKHMNHLEAKRIRIIGKGLLAGIAWSLLIIIAIPVFRLSTWIPLSTVSSYCIFILSFFIRHAMVNYGFLSTASRRYEIIFQHSLHGIVLVDEQGRIMEANAAFLHLVGIRGLEPSMWKNQEVVSFVATADDGTAAAKLQLAFENQVPIHLECPIRNYAGEHILIELSTNFIEVEGRIWTYLMVMDITLQKEHEITLSLLAYQDPLTELANRRRFYEELDGALSQISGTGTRIAVFLIDLDHFKWVNDTLGHAAGDEFLQELAQRLRAAAPEDACVARLGGDEFAILIPKAESLEQVRALADRLVTSFQAPVVLNRYSHEITASIGICFAEAQGTDRDTIIRNADTAMYMAKNKGRNQYMLSVGESPLPRP